MHIQTLNKRYFVIEKRSLPLSMKYYVCREDDDSKEEILYGIVSIESKNTQKKLVPMLMEEVGNVLFEDIIECFTYRGAFCVAFRYYEGNCLLEDMESGQRSLRERLEIVLHILEGALKENLSTYFLMEAVSIDKIRVSEDLSVHVNFDLTDIPLFEVANMEIVKRRFVQILQLVFDEELEQHSLPEMETFMESLGHEGYEELLSIYRTYKELYEKYVKMDEEGLIKPRNLLFFLWNQIKTVGKNLKKILAVLIILLILGYLLYTIFVPQTPHGQGDKFKSIGTVVIEEK